MVNPKTILAEWVTSLRSLPNLIQALDGHAQQIQAYSENTILFGQQTQNNVRLAILSMPPGSIMIVWQGTRPGRWNNAIHFVHEFSLYLVAPQDGSIGYEDIFNWMVNDVPGGQSLTMLNTSIDPSCEPMNGNNSLPAAQRNTVVVGADGSTFEYFEVRVSLLESMNPGDI